MNHPSSGLLFRLGRRRARFQSRCFLGLFFSGLLFLRLTSGAFAFSATAVAQAPASEDANPASVSAPSLSPQPAPRFDVPGFFLAPPSTVETGWIQLSGVRLFQIAGYPASLAERRQRIQANLMQISQKLLQEPKLTLSVEVRESNQSPVLYVNNQYFVTVTEADAQLQGLDAATWAEQLQQIVQEGLVTLHLQHQPDYLRSQVILLGLLFLLLCTATLLLMHAQQKLRQRPMGLLAHGTSLVLKKQSRLQQTRMRELQRLMFKTVQISLWVSGGLFALGRFPQTRALALSLITVLRIPVVLALALLGGYVLVRLTYILVDRFSLAVSTNPLLPADASDRALQRVNTLSQVVKGLNVLLISLAAFIVSLIVLGIDIGPVLAGAGILGVGLSLASQGLIKDAINGLLIVLEDQYGVGDVIQIGEWVGLVESLNLRMTQLRNAEGQLITIPNSEIKVVANLSSQWARVDLNVPVPYEADLEAVMLLIEQTAIALSKEVPWQDLILEPPTMMGVEDFGDRGLIVKLWIKTQPLKKVDVARECRRRLKLAFDRAGIHIPLAPHAVAWPSGELGDKKIQP